MAHELTNKTRDPILVSITDGVFTVDMEWRMTSIEPIASSGMRGAIMGCQTLGRTLGFQRCMM